MSNENKKFYETDKFKKIQQKWKEKLEKSGFTDIEDENGYLKEWATSRAALEQHAVLRDAKEIYYRLASQFLHTYSFKSQLEYNIWKLHCEGKSYPKIEKELNLGINRARYTIKRLKDEMQSSIRLEADNDE